MKEIKLPLVPATMTREQALRQMTRRKARGLVVKVEDGYGVVEFKHLSHKPDQKQLGEIKLGKQNRAIEVRGRLTGQAPNFAVFSPPEPGLIGIVRKQDAGALVHLGEVFQAQASDFVVVSVPRAAHSITVVTRSEEVLGLGPADWYCTGVRTHYFTESETKRLKKDGKGRRLCNRCNRPLERLP